MNTYVLKLVCMTTVALALFGCKSQMEKDYEAALAQEEARRAAKNEHREKFEKSMEKAMTEHLNSQNKSASGMAQDNSEQESKPKTIDPLKPWANIATPTK